MTQSLDLEIGRPGDDAEIKAFTVMVSQALFFPSVDMDAWVKREGHDNVRVARRGGKVVGGLTLQRMGQWFGGRSVPMTGVRAVGVAPEHRASGVASQLVRAALEEMHRDGVPLSVLYPATQPVYRRPGFEQAGTRMRYQLATPAIDVRDRTLELRRMETSDHPAVRGAYAERAKRTSGNLDRSEWLWRRVFEPPLAANQTHGYLAAHDGQVQGYVIFTNKGSDDMHNELEVIDFVVLTAPAGRRLLTMLADHRSVTDHMNWHSGPADPLIYLLAEQRFKITDRMDWMLRLVDVPGALAQRGYPAGLAAELHLEVIDDVLPHNNRRFVLQVADSQGDVREGGRGDLRIDVRGLAAMYTGHLAPAELQATGYLEGPHQALATAGAVFAGPAPWMPDIF
ncbi:MAG: GNAT family N-acetyltransferase [Planctomycetota bacterium]|jgi:predicted acetyltransferase